MLPTMQTLLMFCVSTFALLIVPGPSVVYVITRSVEQGRFAGLLAMLGLETGALIHVVAAATGLASVLAASPSALTAVRWIGAGYLVYLAIRQWHTYAAAPCPQRTQVSVFGWRLFRDGVLVDLLNPKTCIFFMAFLPQFVDAGRGSAQGQMLTLGLCFIVLACVCDSAYALVSGGLGERLRRSQRLGGRVNRATSGVYVLLALTAVAS